MGKPYFVRVPKLKSSKIISNNLRERQRNLVQEPLNIKKTSEFDKYYQDVIYNTTLGDGVFNGGDSGAAGAAGEAGTGSVAGGLANVRGIDDIVKLFKDKFAGEGGGLGGMISNAMSMLGDGGENPTGPTFAQ